MVCLTILAFMFNEVYAVFKNMFGKKKNNNKNNKNNKNKKDEVAEANARAKKAEAKANVAAPKSSKTWKASILGMLRTLSLGEWSAWILMHVLYKSSVLILIAVTLIIAALFMSPGAVVFIVPAFFAIVGGVVLLVWIGNCMHNIVGGEG